MANATRRPRLMPWLWFLSVVFIVYGTTIPFTFVADRGAALEKLSHVSFNPLAYDASGRRVSIPDFVQNTLLFVPFGVFGLFAMSRRVGIVSKLLAITLAGMLLSAALETTQLFTTDRITAVSDVLANSLGSLSGVVFALVLSRTFRGLVRGADRAGVARLPAFYPLLVTAAVVVAAAWEPFDPSLDVGTVWPRVKMLLRDPLQARVPADELLQVLRYAVLTFLTATWLRQIRLERPVVIAMAVCGAVGLALEASQVVIGSRLPGLEDALVNTAGVLVGAAVVTIGLGPLSSRVWLVALAFLTWIGTAMQMLSPFTLASTHATFTWVPFLTFYAYTSTQTLSHTFELLLAWFPLGFAIAWTMRDPASARAAALALVMPAQLGIEYLQGWVVGCYPDITDVGLAALGAITGIWAARAGQTSFAAYVESVTRRPRSEKNTLLPTTGR